MIEQASAFVLSFRNSAAVPLRKVLPMAVTEELLEILACPACKAEVKLEQERDVLKCVKCKRVYPIRDDIPVMLIEEATIEE